MYVVCHKAISVVSISSLKGFLFFLVYFCYKYPIPIGIVMLRYITPVKNPPHGVRSTRTPNDRSIIIILSQRSSPIDWFLKGMKTAVSFHTYYWAILFSFYKLCLCHCFAKKRLAMTNYIFIHSRCASMIFKAITESRSSRGCLIQRSLVCIVAAPLAVSERPSVILSHRSRCSVCFFLEGTIFVFQLCHNFFYRCDTFKSASY